MPKYNLLGVICYSVQTVIEAESEADARAIAERRVIVSKDEAEHGRGYYRAYQAMAEYWVGGPDEDPHISIIEIEEDSN